MTGAIIHLQGNSESGIKNNERSQRKIGEEKTYTDQEKCSKSTVPPPYVPDPKSKSFLTSKRTPASTVPSPYLRETKKTISAPKIPAVPQSYIRAIDSNKNSLPIFERNQKDRIEQFSENSYGTQKCSPLRKCIFERNTNHEPNIQIASENLFPHKKYFSLFHTVASRTIPVKTISSKKPSTNTVKIVASKNTATDDPT